MPLIRTSAAALAALALSGAAFAAEPVRIQLFGDSTQYGYDGRTEGQVAHPPAAMLQQLMDARFGAGRVLVTERAVPGSASGQLLAGTDGRNRAWPKEVAADIVVVNHALNDADAHVPLARYARNLRRLHATVFETPSPVTVPGWRWAPYAQAMRRVAAEQHAPVADVARWMLAQPGWQSHLTDGVHPDDETYGAIVREVLMPTLAPLVDKALAGR